MNNEEKTFSIADLDKVISAAVVIETHASSGLFGPGFIRVFTNGEAYIADFPDLGISGWWELDKLHAIFKRKEAFEGTRHPYLVEGDGWTYLGRERLLIRDDFREAFMAEYSKGVDKAENAVRYVDIPGLAARALGVDHIERFRYRR